MKKIMALALTVIAIFALAACKTEENGATESGNASNERGYVECAIDFPTLLPDGGLQYGSGMDTYENAKTLEDILKGGINGKTEAVFDEEGNLIELGGIKAEGGNYFMYSTFNEQNRYEVLDKKPREIILADFASYAIKLVDENGVEVSHIS